jgi:ACR3 family arsenite efflux pump ArsB
VFTHLGKGDARLTLAATPVLLLVQLALLPLYLALMLGGVGHVEISVAPFVEAFVLLIALPLLLAVATSAGARRSAVVSKWNDAWAWLPVPAMALVLIAVIGSQIGVVASRLDDLLPVVPVYVGFAVLAPLLGWFVARLFRLSTGEARAVTFSAATRNSLVVLPLALALPESIRALAAAAVITQTLVELVSELVYVRVVPALVRR